LLLAVFILPIPHVKAFLLRCGIGKIGEMFPAIYNHCRFPLLFILLFFIFPLPSEIQYFSIDYP